MAATKQLVQVGRRKIELSNLSKILFPEDGISKAQLIEYYLKLAPTVLAHLKGRPLSVVRFREGISGESFFQKDKPKWAPEWIEHALLGEETKDYVIATEEATLVWLANLACIELHQMQCRAPHFDKADYIVYDFDPPEGGRFAQVAEMAIRFRKHLEGFGYAGFVKTTGRKGLHVVTPIEPKWGIGEAFEAAKAVAVPFVEANAAALTLQIRKEHRKGRTLLDIYRNRPSQTIVAAYSVRGSNGAPVSTPLNWEELENLESPSVFHLHSVPNRVAKMGDPWEAIGAAAGPIHTARKASIPVIAKLPPAKHYKTPEQLKEYGRKRSFDKTKEPAPAPARSTGSAFVVHRHHASHLHYDLRLEKNGILKSWAVPKGLPPRPGIKRLAIQVEDHPLDYVNFEGAIPRGEYGGGMMWKFAQGRYEITKEKKDGFYFRLQSRELNAEYRMHQTQEKQWLLERVDAPQTDWLRDTIEPMLARAASSPPISQEYLYEVKWDGIRALVTLDEGAVRIRGRNGLDITSQFPELSIGDDLFRATSAVFDGEIVCLQADGRPEFGNVIQRMQQKSEGGIKLARARCPSICYLFDCLYLDGRPIINEPLRRRREWLADCIRKSGSYRMSETVEDGAALFEAAKGLKLEGIMAKKADSVYMSGKRSEAWLKIKARQTMECVILGYTRGKGDRQGTFGAIHLGEAQDEGISYLGKAGTGFDEKLLKAVAAELKKLPQIQRPVKERPTDEAQTVWVKPRLMCEVEFSTRTRDGILREPVFLRLRPDLTFCG